MISVRDNRTAVAQNRWTVLRRGWSALALLVLLTLTGSVAAQDIKLPQRPDPPRLVNDYAGMLSTDEAEALESRLDQYAHETSTQIAVVIITTLDGADRAQYATELIHEWGIGQKDKDNGVLILIAKEDRSMFLATGRGVEGALPDAICKRITEYTIKPQFKAGNYAEGINAGIDDIQSALKGEFKNDTPQDDGSSFPPGWLILLGIILVLILAFFGGGNNGRTYSSSGSSLPWFLLGALTSGGRSSGGDDWGGGGGGFGGFGGGDSGGGGAGSNW